MKAMQKKGVAGGLTLGLLFAPTLAWAQESDGILGLIRFGITLMQESISALGLLFALLGIIAMGFGVFQLIQHFRTESRDDPNQKSRLVFGIVSFIGGMFLAGGAYQEVGSQTEFTGSLEHKAPVIVTISERDALELS